MPGLEGSSVDPQRSVRFGKDLARMGDAFGKIREQDMDVDPTLAYRQPVQLSKISREIVAKVASGNADVVVDEVLAEGYNPSDTRGELPEGGRPSSYNI